MNIIKTKQKKGGGFDSHLVDRVIALYPPYGAQKKSRRGRPNEIKSWIRILREAGSIVRYMQPFLCLDEKEMSSAQGVLKEAAHALLSLAEGGRPAEAQLGGCANFLGNIFKQDTGSYHWEWVGKAMVKGFPGALPPAGDGGRDVALWAHNLAKRYRKLREDDARRQKASFRDNRGRLRQRLADPHPKSLATLYPSLLKVRSLKFWPDELPSHSPEKCSMCLERRKRVSARGVDRSSAR